MAHQSVQDHLKPTNDEDPSTELPSISNDSQDSPGSNQVKLLTTLGTVFNTAESKRTPIKKTIIRRMYSSLTSMMGKLYSSLKFKRHKQAKDESEDDESVSSIDSSASQLSMVSAITSCTPESNTEPEKRWQRTPRM